MKQTLFLLALTLSTSFVFGQKTYPPNVTKALTEYKNYEITFDTLGYLSIKGRTEKDYPYGVVFDVIKDKEVFLKDIFKSKYLSHGCYSIWESMGHFTTTYCDYALQIDSIFFTKRDGDDYVSWEDATKKMKSNCRLKRMK